MWQHGQDQEIYLAIRQDFPWPHARNSMAANLEPLSTSLDFSVR